MGKTHNSVYVEIEGEMANRRSVLLRNFVSNGQISASNPLLHIHAKRYRQYRAKTKEEDIMENIEVI